MKNMDVKVSAIVPVYNTEKFLEKCIRSIMSQTLKEIEIICINDGSTDNSLEILKKLQKEDNRIIIIDKKNEGVSKARNIGIERARGEFLSFIDSDDWIEKEYYEICYKELIRTNSDIIITDFFSEKFNGTELVYKKDIVGMENIKKIEYIEAIILVNVVGALWNKIIRKKILEKNNIRFQEGLMVGEDIYFLIQISNVADKIIKLNKAFLHYVQHDNNTIKIKKIEYMYNFYEVYSRLTKELFGKISERKIITGYIVIVSGIVLKNKKILEEKNEYYLKDYLNKILQVKLKLIKSIKLKVFIEILKIVNKKEMFRVLLQLNKIYLKIKNRK